MPTPRPLVTLNVPFWFSAWHSLPSRPERHEHTFEVTVSLCGPIAADTGMVVDILKLQPVLNELRQRVHGKTLNGLAALQDTPAPVNLVARFPTCETLARYFAFALPALLEGLIGAEVKLDSITVRLDDQSQELGHAVLRVEG
ncbi:MAG: 6-carboxytetrahydropterin synthase [Planctomycetota bacterium]